MDNHFSIDCHVIWKPTLNMWKTKKKKYHQRPELYQASKELDWYLPWCAWRTPRASWRETLQITMESSISTLLQFENIHRSAVPHRNIKMFQSLRFSKKNRETLMDFVRHQCWHIHIRVLKVSFSRLLKDPEGKKWIGIDVLQYIYNIYIYQYVCSWLKSLQESIAPSVQLCYKPGH